VLPAVEFLRYLDKPLLLRTRGYATKGSLSLIKALAGSIEKNGGAVWASCRARRILVNNHKVKGVVINKEGEEIEIKAQAVVSDVGPKSTVFLAGKEHFDKGYLREVHETLWPVPGIYVNFSTPVENPVAKYPRLYLTGTKRVTNIRTPTYNCPELAPPGRHLVTAIGLPGHMTPPFDFKKEIRLFMQELSEQLPGFDQHAEILMVSSFYGDYPIFRTVLGYDLPQRTSVENLYNVGDGVKPKEGWTGSEACGVGARKVADDIKTRIKPSM